MHFPGESKSEQPDCGQHDYIKENGEVELFDHFKRHYRFESEMYYEARGGRKESIADYYYTVVMLFSRGSKQIDPDSQGN